MTTVHPSLIRVRAARRVSLEARQKFLDAVHAARKDGLSCAEIGAYSGISRQAVDKILKAKGPKRG